jgi:hypothetical protein
MRVAGDERCLTGKLVRKFELKSCSDSGYFKNKFCGRKFLVLTSRRFESI